MKERVTADDLLLAAEWVEAYDPSAEDAPTLKNVAEWMREQAGQKMKAEFVRKAMKETGCSRARALAYFKERFGDRG